MRILDSEEILAAFADDGRRYPRAALDAAVGRADELAPRLLALLQSVAEDPEGWLETRSSTHVYAAILLAHGRDPRVHPLFLRLFRLPEEILDRLFGDMITECFPAFLLRTCGDSLDGVRALAEDREAYDFCRTSALEALAYAVPLGLAPREEVLAFYRRLLSAGDGAEGGSNFWDGLANAATDLHPEELLPELRAAYDRGLIDPRAISLADVERELSRGKEATLAELARQVSWRVPADVHGYLRWSEAVVRERGAAGCGGRGAGGKKAKSRRKKKLAKSAKQRNRR